MLSKIAQFSNVNSLKIDGNIYSLAEDIFTVICRVLYITSTESDCESESDETNFAILFH